MCVMERAVMSVDGKSRQPRMMRLVIRLGGWQSVTTTRRVEILGVAMLVSFAWGVGASVRAMASGRGSHCSIVDIYNQGVAFEGGARCVL